MSDLTLEVNPHSTFARKENRQAFIAFIVDLLAAGNTMRKFEPYQLNPSSGDLEWVVDAGNDWWVFFDRENPLRVRVKQRYDVPQLQVLGQWMAYRWRAEIVVPAVVA